MPCNAFTQKHTKMNAFVIGRNSEVHPELPGFEVKGCAVSVCVRVRALGKAGVCCSSFSSWGLDELAAKTQPYRRCTPISVALPPDLCFSYVCSLPSLPLRHMYLPVVDEFPGGHGQGGAIPPSHPCQSSLRLPHYRRSYISRYHPYGMKKRFNRNVDLMQTIDLRYDDNYGRPSLSLSVVTEVDEEEGFSEALSNLANCLPESGSTQSSITDGRWRIGFVERVIDFALAMRRKLHQLRHA